MIYFSVLPRLSSTTDHSRRRANPYSGKDLKGFYVFLLPFPIPFPSSRRLILILILLLLLVAAAAAGLLLRLFFLLGGRGRGRRRKSLRSWRTEGGRGGVAQRRMSIIHHFNRVHRTRGYPRLILVKHARHVHDIQINTCIMNYGSK